MLASVVIVRVRRSNILGGVGDDTYLMWEEGGKRGNPRVAELELFNECAGTQ